MAASIIKSLFIYFIVAIGLISCERKTNDKEKQQSEQETRQKSDEVVISQEQFENAGMKLGQLEQKNLKNLIKVNGFLTVAPQHRASISPYIGGVVKSIFVQEGDYVKKGETLALLEHPEYIQLQNDYLTAKNTFAFTEKEYIREKELFEKNLSSAQSFQQTESAYISTKTVYVSLEKKIEMLNIDLKNLESGNIVSSIPVISPIGGYVQTVGITLGKYIDPLQGIFYIIDNSQIQLSLQVYEKDIFKIKTGEKIYFTLPNQKNIFGYAVVFSAGKVLDDNTKSITVIANVIGNTQRKLLPGIYVNASIETGMTTTAALPSESIINEEGKNRVFVLLQTKDDVEGTNPSQRKKKLIFGMKDVKIGITEAGFTEVTFLEEISNDVKIITKGVFFIESEMNKKGEE